MGIDRELAKEYENILLEGYMHLLFCPLNLIRDKFGESARYVSSLLDSISTKASCVRDCLNYASFDFRQRNGTEETTAEGLRPGFARLSFPYFMSETEVAFVLEALKMVATEGWKLLPQYMLNPDTGEWRHHTNSVFKERKWLGSIRYTDGKMNATERRVSGSGIFPQSYGDCLQTARNIFNRARKMAQRYPLQIDKSFNLICKNMEALRWFMLPSEAQDLLLGNSQNVKQDVPFNPLLAWNRYSHTHTTNNCHDSLVNCLANGIRRLNSDIPRTGNSLMSSSSPRHRSLPALSTIRRTLVTATTGRGYNRPSSSSNSEEESPGQSEHGNSLGRPHRSPATCPNSPMPVRFAVGEAVTSSMLGSISRTDDRRAKEQRELDAINAGRTRCNSLGSTDGCNTTSNRVGAPSAASPIPPLPLSPQTLTSLGLSTSNSASKHKRLHCSCSSQTDLHSLELDTASPSHSISSLSYNHNPASPPSSYSSTSDYTERLIGGGRSSPISVNAGQRSEDDLSAYVKEVTKELATEIKSEIREVISKVDDVLSETNTSESTPQHHSRAQTMFNQTFVEDKHQSRHDSFTASDIAEYLMEFSKEMASEVKSEIR